MTVHSVHPNVITACAVNKWFRFLTNSNKGLNCLVNSFGYSSLMYRDASVMASKPYSLKCVHIVMLGLFHRSTDGQALTNISSLGFQFLLLNLRMQVWHILQEYLKNSEVGFVSNRSN